jgi:hypothetical protein
MGGGGSRWSPPPPPPRNCDAELNNMRNNYNGQLNNLRNQLNNKQNEVNWLYGRINDINNELNSSRESDREHIRQLNDWRMKYDESQKNVANLKTQIKSLEQQIEDLLKRIANLKVSAEVSSDTANAAIANLEKMSNMGPENEPIREGVMGMFNDLVAWMNQNNNTMYDAVLAQNTTLDKQIQDMKNQYTTDDQKTVYQLQQNDILNKVNIWLLITYYALVLVFGYTLYKTNKTLSIYLVVLAILLAAAYPWVISPVESAVYFVWRLGVAVIHGDVSGK